MGEGRVKKILLATDLGARSDRALDRAVMLAAEWRAQLLVLHVLEEENVLADQGKPVPVWRRPPDPKSVAKRRIEADLKGLAVSPIVFIEKGDPGEVILRVAEVQGCDLVVTGLARDEPLGRFSPGATVDRLLRQSGVLLLVVKERPRRSYRDVVVAADFSKSARVAIETAAELFPKRPLTVLHGYDAPMAGLMEDPETYRRNYVQVATADYAKFIGTVRLPQGHEPPNVLIESGEPGPLLDALAQERDVDLIVFGTHGRGALFKAVIGSTARQLLGQVPCDALVVPLASTREADTSMMVPDTDAAVKS